MAAVSGNWWIWAKDLRTSISWLPLSCDTIRRVPKLYMRVRKLRNWSGKSSSPVQSSTKLRQLLSKTVSNTRKHDCVNWFWEWDEDVGTFTLKFVSAGQRCGPWGLPEGKPGPWAARGHGPGRKNRERAGQRAPVASTDRPRAPVRLQLTYQTVPMTH